jgi:peroxiredoxin
MAANLCLITCALMTAQPAERSEFLLFPRLSQGQELVYRGTYSEDQLGREVQFNRSYKLETRLFVLNTASRDLEIALYTLFRGGTPRPQKEIEVEPTSARLEVIKLSAQGKLSAEEGLNLCVPLQGPPTVETGALVEFPRGRISVGQTWQVMEENRPPRIWKLVGPEVVNNTTCLRLECLQQSLDWEQPRGAHAVWRRRDTVWVPPNLGVAYKVERTIERRDLREVTQRLMVQYELQSNVQYPGRLFEDRRREIMQARSFDAALAPMLPNPTRYPARNYDAMLTKINHHIESEPRTPYREAVLQVKRRVEAARRGDMPPSTLEDGIAYTAALGQRAPDFFTTNLLTRESVRLRRYLGQPIVMVFYSPNSSTVEDVLRFAQRIQNSHHDRVQVLGLALSDDAALAQKQAKDFRLSLSILGGRGLRQSYHVDVTPKLFVIDSEGVIRGSYEGWGPETAASVNQELSQCLGGRTGNAAKP